MTRKIERQLANSVSYAAKALEAWHASEDKFRDMIAQLEALDLEEKGSFSPSIGAVSVHLYGDKQLLVNCVRILRRYGYKTPSKPPALNSPLWSPTYRREDQFTDDWYNKSYAEREELEKLWPAIHLYFNSTVCQIVQVGTEMKEVPIYETRCGDGASPEELGMSEAQPEGNSMPAEATPEAQSPSSPVDDWLAADTPDTDPIF